MAYYGLDGLLHCPVCDAEVFDFEEGEICSKCKWAPVTEIREGSNMSDIVLANDTSSPFDKIRHVDEQGEYWLARELMELMQYTRWEKFEAVVVKAHDALVLVQGSEQASHHFTKWGSDGGRWGNKDLEDFRLTRFGAYLVAMAGDDTKEAIALARVYFAVKSREAEVLTANLPSEPRERNAVLYERLAAIERETARIEREAARVQRELETTKPKATLHNLRMIIDEGYDLKYAAREFGFSKKQGGESMWMFFDLLDFLGGLDHTRNWATFATDDWIDNGRMKERDGTAVLTDKGMEYLHSLDWDKVKRDFAAANK